MIELETWEHTASFECNTASKKETTTTVNKIDKKVPVLYEHIVPGTGCQFMVEAYDT